MNIIESIALAIILIPVYIVTLNLLLALGNYFNAKAKQISGK